MWFLNKITPSVKGWLSDRGVQDWLASKAGQVYFLELKQQLPGDIYPQLGKRLLEDLQEYLPERDGYSARAIVYLDTIEAIREDRSSEEKLDSAQTWLRDLYHPNSGLMVVMAGRDRLNWDRVDPVYDNPEHLEQHLIGGLSQPDAVTFLSNCGITDPSLQKAILAVSLDTETSSDLPTGYHAFSLGLCADTCWNLLRRNEPVDADTFDMTRADTHALATRFLRSMGGDGAYAEWLKSLALTPQFDAIAARQKFSEHAGAAQDAAWQTLTSYSFFRHTQQTGWYALHARMREALAERQQIENADLWRSGHGWWYQHWQHRSTNSIDYLAAKAWYHNWCTQPGDAVSQWDGFAEAPRKDLRMANHYTLLDWWAPCELNTSVGDEAHRVRQAAALNSLGIELCQATLGDRAANVQRAIGCYEAALRVYSEQAFPREHEIVMAGLNKARTRLE